MSMVAQIGPDSGEPTVVRSVRDDLRGLMCKVVIGADEALGFVEAQAMDEHLVCLRYIPRDGVSINVSHIAEAFGVATRECLAISKKIRLRIYADESTYNLGVFGFRFVGNGHWDRPPDLEPAEKNC